MRPTWKTPPPVPPAVEEALSEYPGPLRQVLYVRGIDSGEAARAFFSTDPAGLHDPLRLPGMATAVERVQRALAEGEHIAVYGDYDADGVTATALLYQALRASGGEVTTYLPDRFEEGYGLNNAAIEGLAEAGIDLLLTVDCGIRALEEVQLAKDLDVDVIVTDHHHPGPKLPMADAIVSPRLNSGTYPFEELAGVGLAFKLAGALIEEQGGQDRRGGIDLVAIGTVADLAPLQDENRVLVALGLGEINRGSRPGLVALAEAANLSPGSISTSNIGFVLGPRLNAAGRMASAEVALELLLAEDKSIARPLAEKLDRLNRLRQQETRDAVERARELLGSELKSAPVLVTSDRGFHEGTVGLVASRLAEAYHRPALVARQVGEVVRGSARSIPGFHITEALERCNDLLIEFGGHAAAAGFTLKADSLHELRARLAVSALSAFGDTLPDPELTIDAVVELGQLDTGVLEALERMEPFGQGNEAPIFGAFDVRLKDLRQVGRGGSHLKMEVADRAGRPFDAIAFRQGGRAGELGRRVDLAFRYEWNEFRGSRSPQLNVMDVRAAGSVSRRTGT